MKWETRKVGDNWGIFLLQKYCKSADPVCYGIAKNKSTIDEMVERMNHPIYTEKI